MSTFVFFLHHAPQECNHWPPVATIQELHSEIQKAVQVIRSTDYPITAVVSGSELFLRFITLGKFDDKTMDECKQIMVHRGQVFLTKLLESRKVIAQRGAQFITDGCVSVVHSWMCGAFFCC